VLLSPWGGAAHGLPSAGSTRTPARCDGVLAEAEMAANLRDRRRSRSHDGALAE
jgi:hypothetical protein